MRKLSGPKNMRSDHGSSKLRPARNDPNPRASSNRRTCACCGFKAETIAAYEAHLLANYREGCAAKGQAATRNKSVDDIHSR
jgi:hypothetical protein